MINTSVRNADSAGKFNRTPIPSRRLYVNPSRETLRDWAKSDEQLTRHNSPVYVTQIRSRSAKNTYIVSDKTTTGVFQQAWTKQDSLKLINQVHTYLAKRDVIQIDRVLGNSDRKMTMRMYITKKYARIAMMLVNMYYPPTPNQEKLQDSEIDLITVFAPELNTQNRQIFADVDSKITYITGTDYFGEAKKSFLRQAMFCAKEWGGLGLHAGSKVLKVKNDQGEIEQHGFIMFGLSGTGKTTLTLSDHGLTGEEESIIRQDDVILMMPNGYCYGTEAGFFIKTDGLDENQKILFEAAKSPDASFENIVVNEETGEVDFDDDSLTSNGRGVLMRKDIPGIKDKIDIEKANKIIFITRRNDVMPALAKLNAEQAAAFFMLGESVETGAGDPTKRGQSKRCVGTNPFIVGLESDEGNRVLEILRNNPDIECYLLNTGRVGTSYIYGTEGKKINVAVSTGLMKEIACGTIKWEKDPYWGYEVAVSAKNVDLAGYNPKKYFTDEQYHILNDRLMQERCAWLRQFPGLKSEILHAVCSM
ncbi:phosphoenolpyruvate carboxykinase (ATP) [Clostridium sp. 'deep sea']|uniref:phosphoenolpyruvate carboxykinase (ATP) n=1 Tax=Clostridium sp. 'deep sea' TaxID=2779445 RepID=UPI00189671F1|nr:phosphoenolpyruvate carboxykinase (ATP) [Clostridium sp. 'deep sea']QOR35648.1 phosphoenolpyruvate carboxykinase (ATP) [Clostridium sp. 'deep sea']